MKKERKIARLPSRITYRFSGAASVKIYEKKFLA
jgi:hypothetical protein